MQASSAIFRCETVGCVPRHSSRRRIKHGPALARVVTLEQIETLRSPSVQSNQDVDVQNTTSSLNDSIKHLEALYQRDLAHVPQQQESTAADLAPSLGLRPAHATRRRRTRRFLGLHATSGVLGLDSSSAGSPAVDESSIGASNAEALRTIMDLWQLLHEKQGMKWQHNGRGPTWWQDDPPRLLTAAEERMLGTVIQQHRKLQQLHEGHTDAAAKPHRPSIPSASKQSSSNSNLGASRHGNVVWPPPLTADEVADISSWSPAWRAMLPDLSGVAQQLLVSYNYKLVLHMRQYATSSSVPWQDLLQAGLTGLKVAAQRYDPDRKTRFSTMATLWILQAMNRAANQSSDSRLPERYLTMWRHVLVNHGRQAMIDIDQRTDVIDEVSRVFASKPATVLRILKATSQWLTAGSLDAPNYRGPKGSKGEESVMPWSAMVTSDDLDDDEDADEDAAVGLATEASYVAAAGQVPAWLQQHQQQQHTKTDDEIQLDRWLSVLKPHERRIMMLMYGLEDPFITTSSSSSRQGSNSSSSSSSWFSGSNSNGDHSSSSSGKTESSSLVGRISRNRMDRKMLGTVPLAVVAQKVGVTSERVRQIRLTALEKLKAAAECGVATGRGSSSRGVSESSSSSSSSEFSEGNMAAGSSSRSSTRGRPPHAAATESSAEVGVTSERVRQIRLTALEKLKAAAECGVATGRGSSSSSRGVSESSSSSSSGFDEGNMAAGSSSRSSTRGRPPHSAATDSSAEVGVTSERVRQIRLTALEKLKAAAECGVATGGGSSSSSSSRGISESSSSSSSGFSEGNMAAGSSSRSSTRGRPPHAAATESSAEDTSVLVQKRVDTSAAIPEHVTAAIERAHRARANLRLVYHYYTQYHSMPAHNVVVEGVKVGKYCTNIWQHCRTGRAAPKVVAAFNAIAPGWLPAAEIGVHNNNSSSSSNSGGSIQGSSSSSSSSSSSRRSTSSRSAHAAATHDLEEDMGGLVQQPVDTSEAIPERVTAAIERCEQRAHVNLRLVYHYYTQYHSMPARNVVVEGVNLGNYCANIRQRYRSGEASANVVAAFSVIAPRWLSEKKEQTGFDESYAALVRYVQQYNSLPEKDVRFEGIRLGQWVHKQRYRRLLLAQRRREAMESIPGWTWYGKAGQKA